MPPAKIAEMFAEANWDGSGRVRRNLASLLNGTHRSSVLGSPVGTECTLVTCDTGEKQIRQHHIRTAGNEVLRAHLTTGPHERQYLGTWFTHIPGQLRVIACTYLVCAKRVGMP